MLFKTDKEVTEILSGVNTSFKLNSIRQQIADVERDVILDILGEEEYSSLAENYNSDDDEMTTAQQKLLPFVQNALIHLAFVENIPFLNVDASQGGLRVNVNENRVAASQFRTEDLKRQAAKQGWNAVEALLEFLWAHPDDYEDWAASENKAAYLCYFINSAKDFNKYHDIGKSFQLFRKISPDINVIEQNQLKSVLGNGLFDEIKAQIVALNVSAENKKLLPFIKLALAKLAIVNAVASLSVDLSEVGASENSITGDNMNQKRPARDTIMSVFISKNTEIGENALLQLKNYLINNSVNYPTFVSEFPTLVNPNPDVSELAKNQAEDKVFFF